MSQLEAKLNQNLINSINQNAIQAPVKVYVGLNNSSAALIRVAISQWMKNRDMESKKEKCNSKD